jgi:tetratricopeptide (TPR) repeat protein
VQRLAQDAAQDFSRGDYAAAAKKYERLAILQPESANILNNLGVAYHMTGRFRDAVEVLGKALRIHPELLTANLILGIDYVQLNESERAVPLLEKVLARDGHNRDALMALASAQYSLRQFHLAAKAYQREVKIRPNDSDAWYGLGICFEHLAEETTRRMAKLGKDSPYTLRITGEFLTEQNSSIDAEEILLKALAAEGNQEGLHAALGFAYLRAGGIPRAETEFRAEAQLHPGNLEGKLGLVAIAMERDEPAKATDLLCRIHATDEGFFKTHLDFLLASLREKTLSRVINRLGDDNFKPTCAPALAQIREELTSPQSAVQLQHAFDGVTPRKAAVDDSASAVAARAAHDSGRYSDCAEKLQGRATHANHEALLLARCACLAGRYFVAFDATQSVMVREPQNLEANYWQAEAARKLAQAAFQKAVTLKPDSWQGHLLLGDIYRQRKKWDVAITHYQEAARLKPTTAAPYLGLGTIYWQTGRNPQAEEVLKKALDLDPRNSLANFELGDVYLRMRRYEEAVQYLKEHLALGHGLLVAHGDLGKAFAALGRDSEAISELLLALPTDQQGDLHFQLHTLYKRQGQPELARQALAESERLRAQARENQERLLKRAVSVGESPTPQQP